MTTIDFTTAVTDDLGEFSPAEMQIADTLITKFLNQISMQVLLPGASSTLEKILINNCIKKVKKTINESN